MLLRVLSNNWLYLSLCETILKRLESRLRVWTSRKKENLKVRLSLPLSRPSRLTSVYLIYGCGIEALDESEASGGYTFSWQRNAKIKANTNRQISQFRKKPFILFKNELFEPLLNNTEKKILRNVLNIQVLKDDTQGLVSFGASSKEYNLYTICFMPHCPRALYNNVLSANWSKEQLSRLIFIGNSFDVRSFSIFFFSFLHTFSGARSNTTIYRYAYLPKKN